MLSQCSLPAAALQQCSSLRNINRTNACQKLMYFNHVLGRWPDSTFLCNISVNSLQKLVLATRLESSHQSCSSSLFASCSFLYKPKLTSYPSMTQLVTRLIFKLLLALPHTTVAYISILYILFCLV